MHEPKPLDRVRAAAGARHLSLRTRAGGLGLDQAFHPLEAVKSPHEQDPREGFGEVYLPYASECKYPNAAGE